MTTDTAAGTTTQVYRVFIDAKPQAIWDAITRPEWSQQYGYRGINDYELRPGGHFETRATEEFQAMGMPPVVVDGEVIEADPPRRLVHTWRFLWDELMDEGPTRVTFEIAVVDGGVCSLTVTHELENAPLTAAQLAGEIEGAGGGWAYVLSDIKSLLETGKAMGSAG